MTLSKTSRAATTSSAKNRAVAALTTEAPLGDPMVIPTLPVRAAQASYATVTIGSQGGAA